MTLQTPGVLVLYNEPVLAEDHPDAASEHDVVSVAESVASHLNARGMRAWTASVGASAADMIRRLEKAGPRGEPISAVFNLIEGFGGRSVGATYSTALIELSRIPYTGSPVEALAYCQEKSRAKAMLKGFGLPTAPSALVHMGETLDEWPWDWPVFVKPDAEDGSLGVDQQSVVGDLTSLRQKVSSIHEAYGGAALIEAYLPGREFNVGVLAVPDPEALPIAEVCFDRSATHWPILTYDAKWTSGSIEDRTSPVVCPAQVDETLARRLRQLALEAYRVTGCRDYARIDLRLDAKGEPMILEVNPNPDIGEGAGWARALRASGRDYGATLEAIVLQALQRRQLLG